MGCISPGVSMAQDAFVESSQAPLRMHLAEAIMLALRHIRSVKSAYLDRVNQKYDLEAAEDRFHPDVVLESLFRISGTETRNGSTTRTHDNRLGTNLSVVGRTPTGGAFNFAWAEAVDQKRSFATTTARQADSSWLVSFSHALLKGAGIAVNTAPVKNARIQEKVNILSLKATLINTVNAVIFAYRSFPKVQRQVEISRASLETNRLPIETGRMAAMEIIQTEADIAGRMSAPGAVTGQNHLEQTTATLERRNP